MDRGPDISGFGLSMAQGVPSSHSGKYHLSGVQERAIIGLQVARNQLNLGSERLSMFLGTTVASR